MSAKIAYTEEDIKRLEKVPGVSKVFPSRIEFDVRFKSEVYDEWLKNKRAATIRRAFDDRGADSKQFDDSIFQSLHSAFKVWGRPSEEYDTGQGLKQSMGLLKKKLEKKLKKKLEKLEKLKNLLLR